MHRSSRFPHLALPFSIVGAAAGWLSAALFQNPVIVRVKPAPQLAVTLLAALMAGLTGELLRRLCTTGPYSYQLDEPYPITRPPLDAWVHHAGAVLAAGALTGALVAGLFDAYDGVAITALGGLGCAVAFVPVCLAVLAAARRAQRARLGSLVASSDRRAVWGILATALSVTTLLALPNWAAAAVGDAPSQIPVTVMLAASALGIAFVLAADLRALRRVRREVTPDLVAKDASQVTSADTATPRFDLGLGDDVAARVARPQSAYRGQERAIALVVGSPWLALVALKRAARRGGIGLAIVATVAGLHVLGDSGPARYVFDQDRCESFDFPACARVADRVRLGDPRRAMQLYATACGRSSVESCVTAANMYESSANSSIAYDESVSIDPEAYRARAVEMFQRACRYGDRRGCARAAR